MADIYETRFRYYKFGDYEITEMINYGKSAVVFKGYNANDKQVAIKIFDNELIARYGETTQKQRIFRENTLKNHNIDGLVDILDGGTFTFEKTETEYFYIVMPFLQGCNLKEYIEKKGACDEDIAKKIFRSLHESTEELLKLNIAHRDIKPENIMMLDNGDIVLMDLGVLKLIGTDDLTDVGESKPFIGTLRYAPPEFLRREESNTIDGWKAVNIYQIGAVLYDILMGTELFKQYSEPYANLVYAVCESIPHIDRADCDQEFVQLVRNMLIKNWQTRISHFNKANIPQILSASSKNSQNDLLSAILSPQSKYITMENEIQQIKNKKDETLRELGELQNKIGKIIESCLTELEEKKAINEWFLSYDGRPRELNRYVKAFILSGEGKQGFFSKFAWCPVEH